MEMLLKMLLLLLLVLKWNNCDGPAKVHFELSLESAVWFPVPPLEHTSVGLRGPSAGPVPIQLVENL